jgi:LEA14-like dessication related protein
VTARWLAALLSALLLAACAGSGYRPHATVELLDIRPQAADAAGALLTLVIRNPAGTALPLTGLTWRLALDDREFAWGSSEQSVELPAQSEAVLEIAVAGDTPGVAATGRLHYRLTGELELAGDAGRMPFETNGTLERGAGVAR